MNREEAIKILHDKIMSDEHYFAENNEYPPDYDEDLKTAIVYAINMIYENQELAEYNKNLYDGLSATMEKIDALIIENENLSVEKAKLEAELYKKDFKEFCDKREAEERNLKFREENELW